MRDHSPYHKLVDLPRSLQMTTRIPYIRKRGKTMASRNMHAVAKAAVPQQLSNYIFIVAHQTLAKEIVKVNHLMKHKFTKQLYKPGMTSG